LLLLLLLLLLPGGLELLIAQVIEHCLAGCYADLVLAQVLLVRELALQGGFALAHLGASGRQQDDDECARSSARNRTTVHANLL
jgi:hypothetical protein